MSSQSATASTDSASPRCRLVETRFDAMTGFAEDDHRAAMRVFLRSARAIAQRQPALREALRPDDGLRRLCDVALALPEVLPAAEARRFFETHFTPHRLDMGTPGFLTGYYEPMVDGSLEPSPDFAAPLLRRPRGLERLGPGVADHPYLDREAIESLIGTPDLQPVVWLRDWVEVFLVQVQGSARVRLPCGKTLRLVYDGRNGHAYTSIGRLLVEQGDIPADTMSLDRLKAWIRDQGQTTGAPGRRLMQRNRSYIFFRDEPDQPDEGPVGGAGVPLSRLRSIAVDRTLWPYGLPFFIEADLPWRGPAPEPFRRLMIAQDTGSAILGAARADVFFGSGEEAGRRAGDMRHAAAFTVLLPRDTAVAL